MTGRVVLTHFFYDLTHLSVPAGPHGLITAVARLFVAGTPINWGAFFTGAGTRRVDLPTYAFQHRRYWLEPKITASASITTPAP